MPWSETSAKLYTSLIQPSNLAGAISIFAVGFLPIRIDLTSIVLVPHGFVAVAVRVNSLLGLAHEDALNVWYTTLGTLSCVNTCAGLPSLTWKV
ncbi:hypothetical protein [Rufibacter sp. LB8]|uniref:hypothetical protein n=1 Tax=Rufibacter sp. LB8 TaxID=2777781 RepID=UPI001CEF7103|nr:hypothetical protein [Rufibacter sp. LB8]